MSEQADAFNGVRDKSEKTIINARFLFTTLNKLYKMSVKGTLHTKSFVSYAYRIWQETTNRRVLFPA